MIKDNDKTYPFNYEDTYITMNRKDLNKLRAKIQRKKKAKEKKINEVKK